MPATPQQYDSSMDEQENEPSRLVDQLNRSAAGVRVGKKRSIGELVTTEIQSRASDILLIAGSPATMRVNGALTVDSAPPISAEGIRELLLPLLSASQLEELNARKCMD